jgi:hypothetical protein
MPKIFISYRRDDSAAHAGRLFDRLENHFGQGQVFMDVDNIKPGLDFIQVVEQAVGVCDGLIAVIGREWLNASDPAGTGARRIDDPADLVRLEIASALEREITVIPVLVQGARMPRRADLPENLKGLANRNALEVSDGRFRTDITPLIEVLGTLTSQPVAKTGYVEPLQDSTSGFVGRGLSSANTGHSCDYGGRTIRSIAARFLRSGRVPDRRSVGPVLHRHRNLV